MKSIIILVSMLFVGGCSGKPRAILPGSPSNEIVKSVAISMVKSNQKEDGRDSFSGWFIETSLVHWIYISNAFVGSIPPVKFADQCIKFPNKVVDKHSKRAGILISINEPLLIDGSHAEVTVRYYEGPFSFACFIYKLSKVDGEWIIQSFRVTAAS